MLSGLGIVCLLKGSLPLDIGILKNSGCCPVPLAANPERTWRTAALPYEFEIQRDSMSGLLNVSAPVELGGLGVLSPLGLPLAFTNFQKNLAAMYLQKYENLAHSSTGRGLTSPVRTCAHLTVL